MSESQFKKCPKCGGELETLEKNYDYVDNKIMVTVSNILYCKNCRNIESYKEMKRKATNVELRIDERLTQDTRNILLRHYSSKSTNQTAIILTLAIIFFSFVQALPYLEVLPNWVVNLIVVLTLTLLSFLTIRALSRLFVWGKIAGTVLYVRMLNFEELEKRHLTGRTLERLILAHHFRLDEAAWEEAFERMHLIGQVLNGLTRVPYSYFVLYCIFVIFGKAMFRFPIVLDIICLLLGGIALLCLIHRYIKKKRRMLSHE